MIKTFEVVFAHHIKLVCCNITNFPPLTLWEISTVLWEFAKTSSGSKWSWEILSETILFLVKYKDIENIWIWNFVEASKKEIVDIIVDSFSANNVWWGDWDKMRILTCSITVLNAISIWEFYSTSRVDIFSCWWNFCRVEDNLTTTVWSIVVTRPSGSFLNRYFIIRSTDNWVKFQSAAWTYGRSGGDESG